MTPTIAHEPSTAAFVLQTASTWNAARLKVGSTWEGGVKSQSLVTSAATTSGVGQKDVDEFLTMGLRAGAEHGNKNYPVFVTETEGNKP